jgi:hypothetical protein
LHFNSQWLRLRPIRQTNRPGALFFRVSDFAWSIVGVAVQIAVDVTCSIVRAVFWPFCDLFEERSERAEVYVCLRVSRPSHTASK